MLNKGMHTVKAVRALKQILSEKARQIPGHFAVLKPLRMSKLFFEEYGTGKTPATENGVKNIREHSNTG
jgi:hypothetical protein